MKLLCGGGDGGSLLYLLVPSGTDAGLRYLLLAGHSVYCEGIDRSTCLPIVIRDWPFISVRILKSDVGATTCGGLK
jgi:hypothetical protein